MFERRPSGSESPRALVAALVLLDLGGLLLLRQRPGAILVAAVALVSGWRLRLLDPLASPRRDTRIAAAAAALGLGLGAAALVEPEARVLGGDLGALLGALLLPQLGREFLRLGLRLRAQPVLIRGTGPRARELARAVRRAPFPRLRLLGFVARRGRTPGGLPLFAAAPPGVRVLEPREIRREEGRPPTGDLLVGPDLAIRPAEGPGEGTGRALKRLFDTGLVLTSLPISLPLLLLLILLNRLVQGPQPIHAQTRVTEGGRVFRIYKLRSMPRDAEPGGRPVWPAASDGRITPFGRLLRRSWLDELPQLLNVLRGDLGLVGPRPERPEFVQVLKTCLPKYDLRHRCRAGITGLAQVRGFVGNTSLRKRLLSDRHYIEHWSIWLDAAVLGRTLCQVIKRPTRPRFDYVPGDEGGPP